MKSIVPRFPFWSYYLLALAIALGVMAAYALLMALDPGVLTVIPEFQQWLAGHQRYSNLTTIIGFAIDGGRGSVLLILLFAAAPTLAAGVVTWKVGGRAGLASWLARLRPGAPGIPRRRLVALYGVLAGFYLAGLAGYVWLTFAFAPAENAATIWAILGGSVPAAIGIALAGAFLDEGGTLEEMGWRGMAMPLLQERWSPLSAALLLGLLWWAWHLPREIPALLAGVPLAPWLAGQGGFVLLTLALSVVIAYCVNRAGGSVLPAILIHGGSNFWSKAVATHVNAMFQTDVRNWIVVAGALVVAGIAGRQLGRVPSNQPPARTALGLPPKAGD
ncbi:MAG: CPBP family glutamic-type intramembrane protease [Acidobacteria bacterium]|jgi:membrane protease YdiL (CAAX protease family)|nr:CPBP family glutamic-type intramembrane protease [Acidobacteriota bacterium]